MEILKEIFEIIGLLLSMAAHKTAEVIGKIKQKGEQYLRTLKWLVAIAIIVPLILGGLGIVLRDHSLIGGAGIFLAFATLIFMALTGPMISLLETIYRFFRKDEFQSSETLAKRFVNGVTSVLIVELMITLYFVLIPWETKPGVVLPVLIAMLILFILALRNWGAIVWLIRGFALFIAVCVLIVSTLTFVFPKTMGEMQKSIPTIDEKMQKNVKDGVSGLFEDKPDPPPQPQAEPKKLAQDAKAVEEPKKSDNFFSKFFGADDPEAGKGWATFKVPADVVDAIPTNIHVFLGDTILFTASGETKYQCYSGGKSYFYEFKNADGIWPPWITVEDYREHFREHNSYKCWNLLFRIGPESENVYLNVGSKAMLIAHKTGDIWLRPNTPIGYWGDEQRRGSLSVNVLVRPLPEAQRIAFKKRVDDSVAAFERHLSDSLLAVEVARNDSLAKAEKRMQDSLHIALGRKQKEMEQLLASLDTLHYGDWYVAFEGYIPVIESGVFSTGVRVNSFDSVWFNFSGERIFDCGVRTGNGQVEGHKVRAKAYGIDPGWLEGNLRNGFRAQQLKPFCVIISLSGMAHIPLIDSEEQYTRLGDIGVATIELQNNAPKIWCRGTGETLVKISVKKVLR